MATFKKKPGGPVRLADLSPGGMLSAAVEAVPAVRYALGVGGMAAVVAIVLVGWKLDAQSAIFGTLIIFVFMVGLVVFTALAGISAAAIKPLALFLAWAFLLLMVAVAVLFVFCTFFDWPKTLPCLLRNECGPVPASTAVTRAQLEPTLPITAATLTSEERVFVDLVRKGNYVDVPLGSFVEIAVMSGQVTESELEYFFRSALAMLRSSDDYFVDGDRESLSVQGGGEVFVWRTGSRVAFNNARQGLMRVIQAIQASRGGKPVGNALFGVTITIRGTERFFDVKGVPGLPSHSWVGFDLRR